MNDSVRQTPSGYWEATTDAPYSTAPCRWTKGLFHDEQEARDWLEFIAGLRTDVAHHLGTA